MGSIIAPDYARAEHCHSPPNPHTLQQMGALEVPRVERSEDLAKPGEFVFEGKGQPKITVEKNPLTLPSGFLAYLWWMWFGKRYGTKKIVEVMWPESVVSG